MIPTLSRIALIVTVVFATAPALALQTIGWEDLAPAIAPADDPYVGLSFQQRNDLNDIFWTQRLKRDGARKDASVDDTEAIARKSLSDSGIDVDALIAKTQRFQKLLEKQNVTLMDDMDGRDVKIPGYMLPLETEGTKVVEFLLVPYVGACIHTPPPPINQIIHVTSAEGYTTDALFTPVWVTGRLSTGAQTQSLNFVDGAANVEVGYALQARLVEPYGKF